MENHSKMFVYQEPKSTIVLTLNRLKMVRFGNLVGVDIAPVPKKMAVKGPSINYDVSKSAFLTPSPPPLVVFSIK